jgi:hypothetical protein
MKSRIFSLAFALFIILVTSSGCEEGAFCTAGKGDLVTQTVDVANFTGFRSMGSADVILTQGEAQSVTVTAQQNIIDKLKLEVNNGIWSIDWEGCIRRIKPITIEITLPTLTFAAIEGSGNITATNRFTELDRVELGIEGSGNIDLDLDANSVETWISGSGDIAMDLTAASLDTRTSGSGDYTLSGSADQFNHRISGSGSCAAFELSTNRTEVSVTGSGDCRVTVSDYLNVDISGSGDVHYKGQPTIDVSISGSGNLINAN